jgi:hypothetical protein
VIIPASAKDISMDKSPHFKPDQWMALVPLLAADPPALPVY